MSSDVDGIVQNAIANFQGDLATSKSRHSDLVDALTSEVEDVGLDALDDYFMDVLDEARGNVASKAANRIEEPKGQEEAITQIENWFSNNISDQGAEIAVLCAIWGYGPEQAAGDIRSEIANIPSVISSSAPTM
jgi:hypothetical protein